LIDGTKVGGNAVVGVIQIQGVCILFLGNGYFYYKMGQPQQQDSVR